MAGAWSSWERRILLDADGQRQGIIIMPDRAGTGEDDVAGGKWSFEIQGPADIDLPNGRRESVCSTQRWTFDGAGTFLLRIHVGDDPRPVVSLMGDDATPMGVVRETVTVALATLADLIARSERPAQ